MASTVTAALSLMVLVSEWQNNGIESELYRKDLPMFNQGKQWKSKWMPTPGVTLSGRVWEYLARRTGSKFSVFQQKMRTGNWVKNFFCRSVYPSKSLVKCWPKVHRFYVPALSSTVTHRYGASTPFYSACVVRRSSWRLLQGSQTKDAGTNRIMIHSLVMLRNASKCQALDT